MRKFGLEALRAYARRHSLQEVMRPAFTAPGLGMSALGIWHEFEILPCLRKARKRGRGLARIQIRRGHPRPQGLHRLRGIFSVARRQNPRAPSLPHPLAKLEERGHSRVGLFLRTETRFLVQIRATPVAEPPALLPAYEAHRKRELNLLDRHEIHIQTDAVIEADIHVIVLELNLHVGSRFFRLRQIKEVKTTAHSARELSQTSTTPAAQNRFHRTPEPQITILMGQEEIESHRLFQRRIPMLKWQIRRSKDVLDMQGIFLEIFNFNEHGLSSLSQFLNAELILSDAALVKDKYPRLQALTDGFDRPSAGGLCFPKIRIGKLLGLLRSNSGLLQIF